MNLRALDLNLLVVLAQESIEAHEALGTGDCKFI